jgi:hypothetical protein
VFGNTADEGESICGGREYKFLTGYEAKADADGDFGEAVEFLIEAKGQKIFSRSCGRTHPLRLGGVAVRGKENLSVRLRFCIGRNGEHAWSADLKEVRVT